MNTEKERRGKRQREEGGCEQRCEQRWKQKREGQRKSVRESINGIIGVRNERSASEDSGSRQKAKK